MFVGLPTPFAPPAMPLGGGGRAHRQCRPRAPDAPRRIAQWCEGRVPEPFRDLVDENAGLEQVRGPVGPERVRVREPLRHARGQAQPPDEPVHGHCGERERILSEMKPLTTPGARAAPPPARGPRARDRPCRARKSGGGERWCAGGAGRGPAGRAARPSEAHSRPGPAAARSRACPRWWAGRGPVEDWRNRYRSASLAAGPHPVELARRERPRDGTGRGRAHAPSRDTRARWRAPPGVHPARRRWARWRP